MRKIGKGSSVLTSLGKNGTNHIKSISIVIPTKDRPQQLSDLLNDVLRCDLTPIKEVIIIDESNESAAEQISSLFKGETSIKVSYFRVQLGSLPRARNFAVKETSGQLVLFLDDDVRIRDAELFNKIIKVFKESPHLKLLGILSKRGKSTLRTIYEFARCFFFFNHPSKPFHVFPNGRSGGYLYLTGLKTCKAEWVGGYCLCAKREVFNHTEFEERFIKYSFGEDFLFSHQIYLKYGMEAVKYLIGTNIIHLQYYGGRIPLKTRICMEHSYRIYISNKLGFIPNSLIKKFIWRILIVWGAIGDALFNSLVPLAKSQKISTVYFKTTLSHLIYCFLSLKYEHELKTDPNFIIKNILKLKI